MSISIQLRRDTSANWVSVNPVLAQGEVGVETDTGNAKIGNGTTYWNSLAYWDTGGGTGSINSVFGRTGTVTAQSGDYTYSQVGADASGSASTAQSNAETYASGLISAETSRAETAEALLAPKASPALTGAPTAPTQTTGDNSTKIATDAFVTTAVSAETTRAETAEALALQKSSDLSDLASVSVARTNLGLGTASIQNTSYFDISGAASTAQSNSETYASGNH
jgi:hypothetical protein